MDVCGELDESSTVPPRKLPVDAFELLLSLPPLVPGSLPPAPASPPPPGDEGPCTWNDAFDSRRRVEEARARVSDGRGSDEVEGGCKYVDDGLSGRCGDDR